MADELADVELSGVHSGAGFDSTRTMDPFSAASEEDIETEYGYVRVAVHGDRNKRAMLTYHDLGTNYQICFRGFFAHPDMSTVLDHFCVYHVNAPGHVIESVAFIEQSQTGGNRTYPTLDQLANTITTVAKHYGVKRFVGLGVGAGANVLSRFHLEHPEMTDALVLINPNVTQAGWIEWSWFKLHNWTFNRADQFQTVVDYLAWHWFGDPSSRSHDMVQMYMHALRAMNRDSVSGFVNAYLQRNDLRLARQEALAVPKAGTPATRSFTCSTMLITGDTSPHIDSVVDTNTRTDPTMNSFLKLADCGGMILDEVPGKISEALQLFLQGLGFVRPPRVEHKMIR